MRTNSLILAGVVTLVGACAPSEDVRPPASPALPFIADDYATALAEARARKLPIFIESWAPW
jgi:hypothetical protein